MYLISLKYTTSMPTVYSGLSVKCLPFILVCNSSSSNRKRPPQRMRKKRMKKKMRGEEPEEMCENAKDSQNSGASKEKRRGKYSSFMV